VTTPIPDLSAYGIIRAGMRDAGKLGKGQNPDAEDLSDGMNRLQQMVNLWQTQGLRLWLQFDLSVPLVAGQNPYTIGPGGSVNMLKPLRVLDSCYFLDQYNNRRPLIPLSRDDWMRLSQVTQVGQINSYFVDKQQTQLVVWFWLPPDSEAALGTAHLLIQQQVPQLVNLTDTMSFPIEWAMALHWGFAAEICTGQPESVIARCEKYAALYFDALNNFDVEDASTVFQPDQRSTQHVNRFR
jgi:hypothetical protein